MVPLIKEEIVNKHHYLEDHDILDIIAIGESTPGSIAVNFATFVGLKIGGFLGSLIATVGVVCPSFCLIFLISYFLKQFESLTLVATAFKGIRAGVLALIVKAMFTMYKECPKNVYTALLMVMAFCAVAFFGINVFAVIIVCALIGLCKAFVFEKEIRK